MPPTETTSVRVNKSWIAPSTASLPKVTVRLMRDGLEYRSQTLNGSESPTPWVYTFTNLPVFALDGHKYLYTVDEVTIPGFKKSISGSAESGFVITNTAGGANGKLNVFFIDYDGTLIKHQEVPYGGSARPPADPSRDGWVFAGWTGKYTNVTRDEWVYARYERVVPEGGYTGIEILDLAIPLNGGSVSNYGDCIE